MITTSNTCELLANIGFAALNIAPAVPEEHGDSISAARIIDNHAVWQLLRESKAEGTDWGGVRWLDRTITWPVRAPDIVTWSGQMKLHKLINDRIAVLGDTPVDDLLAYTAGLQAMSGFDARTCLSNLDIGFNPRVLGILIEQYIAAELLAIYGLDTVPLISYAPRVCGIFDGEHLWRFVVERRQADSYYYRWADAQQSAGSVYRLS